MRYFTIIALLLFGYGTTAQDSIRLQLVKQGLTDTGSYFTLKILNNTLQPIGIMTSRLFNRFSEADTLQLKSRGYRGFGLHISEDEANVSHPTTICNLIILQPQTYLLAVVNLIDLHEWRSPKVKFILMYTADILSSEYSFFPARIEDWRMRDFREIYSLVDNP